MDRFLFLFVLLSPVASEPIHLQPGEDAILSCKTIIINIIAVEWTTTNLTFPEYVLFFSDGHSDTTHQHRSFENRVDLQDKQMRDGNLSIIIKNVSSSDSGTYECRVSPGGSRHKRANINSEPIRTITLQVTSSKTGNPIDESQVNGLNHEININTPKDKYHTHLGLVVVVIVLIVFFSGIGLLTKYKYKKTMKQNSDLSTAEKAVDKQLI